MNKERDIATKFFFVFLVFFIFDLGFDIIIDNNKETIYQNTSENIAYQAEEKGIYRVKVYKGYESLEELSSEDTVYKLKLDSVNFGDLGYNINREREIPEVTSSFTLEEAEILNFNFSIILNEKVDRERIRIDVKFVVEKLSNGKWMEVHQSIFKERGPYWSLNKGLVEYIE